jgi:diguanylate cyclase (GGDEF)-like protein
MTSENERSIVDDVSKLLLDIMRLANPPQPPERFGESEGLRELYEELLSLRKILYAASTGDLTKAVTFRGFLAGTLKSLQANLKHLTWQTKMIASGDFSQRVEFMGEFSQSFNAMVAQLDRTLKDLVEKELELSKANEDLLKEIAVRKLTEAALRENEDAIKLLAITDSLTGLYNRRHFNKLADDEINRAIRYSRPLSVMMIDIDFFKRVNDTYGHINGDEVLKAIACIAKDKLRVTDMLARYGGEEFVVLLPETAGQDAVTVAERLRSQIESATVEGDNCHIKVTASFGVSDCLERQKGKPQEKLLTDFIAGADHALYASKNAGRNRVTLFEPGTEASA